MDGVPCEMSYPELRASGKQMKPMVFEGKLLQLPEIYELQIGKTGEIKKLFPKV